ncbi:MAG: alpha/beta hydrolase family protein, partial [Planctomycetota bacterium]
MMRPRYCFWLVLAAILVGSARCTVAVDSVPPILARPLPATTPWDLEELRRAPKFEWAEVDEAAKKHDVRALYYFSEPFRGQRTRVFAYYATPRKGSKRVTPGERLPAIVLVHGGGGTAFPHWARMWADRGYAAIAMDLGGDGPSKKKLPDGGPGQPDDVKFGMMHRPVTDQWTYHAVANVIRAHSLLGSFPEVNPERTAITGISWGGYLTCIVAGLDDRFKAAAPVYGCGFLHDNSFWLKHYEKMSPEHRARWIQLWDPSRYVGSTTVPMLFVNGGKDFAYPPDSHARTYALVRSPKNLHFVPDLRHGHFFGRPKALEVFIEHHIRNGTPLARITSVKVGAGGVTAEVDSRTKLVSADLHYTLSELPGNPRARKWLKLPATITGSRIKSDAPPAGATIWFLTVRDE